VFSPQAILHLPWDAFSPFPKKPSSNCRWTGTGPLARSCSPKGTNPKGWSAVNLKCPLAGLYPSEPLLLWKGGPCLTIGEGPGVTQGFGTCHSRLMESTKNNTITPFIFCTSSFLAPPVQHMAASFTPAFIQGELLGPRYPSSAIGSLYVGWIEVNPVRTHHCLGSICLTAYLIVGTSVGTEDMDH